MAGIQPLGGLLLELFGLLLVILEKRHAFSSLPLVEVDLRQGNIVATAFAGPEWAYAQLAGGYFDWINLPHVRPL